MSKDFESIGSEIGQLVQEKNEAYGNSFAVCGEFLKLLYPNGLHPDQYQDALCLVRIFDKQMRIANKKDAFGESPYRDIVGYGLLGVRISDQPKISEPDKLKQLWKENMLLAAELSETKSKLDAVMEFAKELEGVNNNAKI